MIIVVGGEKGGVGKTTICTNLAVMRINKGKEVLLIDSDTSPISSFWSSLRDENEIIPRVPSIQKYGKSVRTEIAEFRTKYDDIIIDVGGGDRSEMRAALLIADIAILPFHPSQFDLWTLKKMDKLIDEIKQVNEKLKVLACFNGVSSNPNVKEADSAKEFFEEFPQIKLINGHICDRIAFRKASLDGLSVIEKEPKDTKAIAEIMAIYKEVFDE